MGTIQSLTGQSCTSIARVSSFTHAARSYWFSIFPDLRSELLSWQRLAEQIPNRLLRRVALDSLRTKCDVLEGAVTFAAFVAPTMRARVIKAITAFEVTFDYLDSVVELPNPDPILNSHTLCHALHSAFDHRLAHRDYYQHHTSADDGGYLLALVDACRMTLARLPSYEIVAERARECVARIVAYQTLNHGDASSTHDAFMKWARSQSVAGLDLRWWEIGAAFGSQLSILALIAAAADPSTCPARAREIEHAYFPWISALSTLLDSVIDRDADRSDGQRSLIDCYSSPEIAAERLRLITVEAMRSIGSLADAEDHAMILAAMAAFFYSAPQPCGREAKLVRRAVLDAVGAWGTPPLLFLKARRAFAARRLNVPLRRSQIHRETGPTEARRSLVSRPQSSMIATYEFGRPNRRVRSLAPKRVSIGSAGAPADDKKHRPRLDERWSARFRSLDVPMEQMANKSNPA